LTKEVILQPLVDVALSLLTYLVDAVITTKKILTKRRCKAVATPARGFDHVRPVVSLVFSDREYGGKE
jgi:hypothetical protein